MKFDKRLAIPLFLITAVISVAIYTWRGIYLPFNKTSKEGTVFSIKKGEGTKEISFNLEKEGLIKMATLFRIYTIFSGVSNKLQAGEYMLSPSMTIPEIAEKFVSGDVVKNTITIIEGWNLNDVAEYLKGKEFDKHQFLEIARRDFSGGFSFLKDKPKDLSLEGYLFPDTYYINKQQTQNSEQLEGLIRKMLENFDDKLTSEMKKEINRGGKTIFEIVTMASMVEKEVKAAEDKKIISGILWKRLENDIPLQVDATISYITGKKTDNISIEETKIDSPYNTYKYRGLPLGPISNPGLESILAAIYPENSEYWYYLSTPEGKTIFSKTLEEHNIAKAKYLK